MPETPVVPTYTVEAHHGAGITQIEQKILLEKYPGGNKHGILKGVIADAKKFGWFNKDGQPGEWRLREGATIEITQDDKGSLILPRPEEVKGVYFVPKGELDGGKAVAEAVQGVETVPAAAVNPVQLSEEPTFAPKTMEVKSFYDEDYLQKFLGKEGSPDEKFDALKHHLENHGGQANLQGMNYALRSDGRISFSHEGSAGREALLIPGQKHLGETINSLDEYHHKMSERGAPTATEHNATPPAEKVHTHANLYGSSEHEKWKFEALAFDKSGTVYQVRVFDDKEAIYIRESDGLVYDRKGNLIGYFTGQNNTMLLHTPKSGWGNIDTKGVGEIKNKYEGGGVVPDFSKYKSPKE